MLILGSSKSKGRKERILRGCPLALTHLSDAAIARRMLQIMDN